MKKLFLFSVLFLCYFTGFSQMGNHIATQDVNMNGYEIDNIRKLDVGLTNLSPYVASHLRYFTLIDGEQASLLLGNETTGPVGEFGIEYNSGGLNFWKPFGSSNGTGFANYLLFVSDWGNVGIGTSTPKAKLHVPAGNVFIGDVDLGNCGDCNNYRLFVREGIRAEKVKVDMAPGTWADYVFQDDYRLRTLSEVNAFIQENQHLPGMPSAEEVEAEGVDLGQMDARLLEKIEELTLYMIQLEKKNQELEQKVGQLENRSNH